MLRIKWENGDHKIDYTFSDGQLDLMHKYKEPLKRKLAEEQADMYRKDPDTYRYLRSVIPLLDEGIYEPYLGASGGAATFIFYEPLEEGNTQIQYQYLSNKSIWLTGEPTLRGESLYRVTPTSLGYIVKYETDLTNYELW